MEQTNPAIIALLSQVVPFLLVAFRLAGVFLLAPVLSGSMLPNRYKAILVMLLAAAVYPLVSKSLVGPVVLDVFSLVPMILSEALIGFAIGAIASIPLLALEMSGVIASQQMGLGLARVYNPEADIDADVLGQMLYTIAAGAFITCGGVETLMGCVLDSFTTVPLGGFGVASMPLEQFVGALSTGFELALRVTTPVSGAVLLLVIILGVIGKTMPQINIMTIGFTLKILAGLGALMFAMAAVSSATGDEMGNILGEVKAWIHGLMGAGQAHDAAVVVGVWGGN